MTPAFLTPAFLVALAAGADAGTVAATEAAPAIDPVFDCYHVNYAWGFALEGAAIGRDGGIWRYRMRGKDLSPPPIDEGGSTFRDAAALRAKFVHAERSGSVDAQALQDHRAQVAAAAAGKLTTQQTGTRDAGSSTCHAYVADGVKARYRDVELGSDGGVADTRRINDAAAAATLIDWLRSVGVAR